MTSRKRVDDGFALAEVLVAMVLIAVAMTSAAGLVVLAVRVASAAGEQTSATVLATQKIEQLRAATMGTVPASSGSIGTDVPGSVDWLDIDGQPAGGQAAVYVRRWAVGPVPGVPGVGFFQVLVSTVVRDRAAVAGGLPRVRHANETVLVTFGGTR